METLRKGEKRELDVLHAIGLNGWMTVRSLALWVWLESPEHSAINRARMVLKRLEGRNEVLKRETVQGVSVFVLSSKGAERVNYKLLSDGYSRGWAHHGYDIGLLGFSNTLIGIDYLTKKLREPGVVGAIGKAGIRAKIVEGYESCDGVYIRSENGSYTFVGVLVVTNARDGIQAKLKKLAAQNIKLDLVGDSRIIATLRKRTTV